MKTLVSICFPVFQNEGSLRELYQRTRTLFDNELHDMDAEFIFVNDGSTDSSLRTLEEIKSDFQDSRIRIVKLSRNFGQMAAILAGWRVSKGDAVINLAADLQDPPEQCVPMIREWRNGNEIVISHRRSHGTSRINKLTSGLFYKLVLPNAPAGGFDVALLSRKPLEVLLSMPERNKFYQYDLLWLGYSIKFIPYDKLERRHGRSQFGFVKRLRYSLNAIFYTSYLPLRLMTLLGICFAVMGTIYATAIVYAHFFSLTPYKGWAPLMILLLFIGGLIMIMLGVLGEYIWRIFDEVKARPPYIIDEEV